MSEADADGVAVPLAGVRVLELDLLGLAAEERDALAAEGVI